MQSWFSVGASFSHHGLVSTHGGSNGLCLSSLETDTNGNDSIQRDPELLRGAATDLLHHARGCAHLPASVI